MEQTECSETSAYKIQTPGNYQEENIQQMLALFIFPIVKQNLNSKHPKLFSIYFL
jgi:hypothetical protein